MFQSDVEKSSQEQFNLLSALSDAGRLVFTGRNTALIGSHLNTMEGVN